MEKVKRFSILLLLTHIVVCLQAWALTESRLLGISSSGTTALFNIGVHSSINSGEYAIVLKQIRDINVRDLKVVPVAKARNIKINTESSVWVLYYVYDPELLSKGDKYLFFTETLALKGRRKAKLSRLKIISNQTKVKDQVNSELNQNKDRISKLSSKFEELTPLKGHQEISDSDAELIDVSIWKKNKDERHESSIYKSTNKREFQRQLELSTFEKMVNTYLNKVNKPDFNYDAFYDEQKKSEFGNEFKVASSFNTEYADFVRSQSMKRESDARLYRSLLEKGESWSQDFSDEELRTILGEVSILQEKDRRLFVISNPNRYAASLDYGLFITDPQTEKDSYRRSSRRSFELLFEGIPFLKHPSLERISIEGGLRQSQSAFSDSNFNVGTNETSFSLGMNWFPTFAPYTVEAMVLFFGVSLRRGIVDASIASQADNGKYTVTSSPGLKVGVKYNLKNNFGFRFLLNLENQNYDRFESALNTNLPTTKNLLESKLSVGMSYLF
jgi:hypothetical protein